MEEIYVNINGFSNYQISNFGNVKNVKSGRILKPGTCNGYLKVCLCSDGDSSNKTIHRLVANAFLENPDNKPNVDHINGDKTKNHLSNLRFATDSENQQNVSIKKNNTSGCAGVTFNKANQKWHSRINVNGSIKHLGYFINKEDAIRVRQETEILHFGEFRRV